MTIDLEELNKLCDEIYSIRCRESVCVDCQLKYDTVWCPKSYADEIMEGIKAINNNIIKARDIVEIKRRYEEESHDCKKCVYYREDIDKCDGYTYRCECIDSFCPMYEREEIIGKEL